VISKAYCLKAAFLWPSTVFNGDGEGDGGEAGVIGLHRCFAYVQKDPALRGLSTFGTSTHFDDQPFFAAIGSGAQGVAR